MSMSYRKRAEFDEWRKRKAKAKARASQAAQFQAPPLMRDRSPADHPILWGIAQAVAGGIPASMSGLSPQQCEQVKAWASQIKRGVAK